MDAGIATCSQARVRVSRNNARPARQCVGNVVGGYTHAVSWKRPVSIAIVTILTALPVAGAVCAMVCEHGTVQASMAAQHHGSAHAHALHSHHPFSEGRMNGVSGQDCYSPVDGLRQASTAAERADRVVRAVPVVPIGALTATIRFGASGPHVEHTEYTARGTAPPTATPLVLRV